MTLKSLIYKYDSEQIVKRLIELYPDQEPEGYFDVLRELLHLPSKKSNLKILVEELGDVYDKKDYVHVSGKDKKGVIWAIEFIDWKEWLEMEFTQDSLDYFSELDLVCHCLWEMTFCGYSNREVKKETFKLFNMIREYTK